MFVLEVFEAEDLSAAVADAAEDDAKVAAFDFGAPDAEVLVILDLDFVIFWSSCPLDWCCCWPTVGTEEEVLLEEHAPYSEEVGDTLTEEVDTVDGEVQPFTGTEAAEDKPMG